MGSTSTDIGQHTVKSHHMQLFVGLKYNRYRFLQWIVTDDEK